jgi:hypothetical protein
MTWGDNIKRISRLAKIGLNSSTWTDITPGDEINRRIKSTVATRLTIATSTTIADSNLQTGQDFWDLAANEEFVIPELQSSDKVYAKCLAAAESSQTLDNAAAVDKTGGFVGLPLAGHLLAIGTYITIAGTTNYDGSYYVGSDTTANEIVIEATYVAENFGGAETCVDGPRFQVEEGYF